MSTSSKFLFFVFIVAVSCNARADDRCLKYKVSPDVKISFPEYKKVIEQELLTEDALHGNVETSLENKIEIGVAAQFVKDGFCVWLDNMTTVVGYNEFIVHIDERYTKDSCEYNAVLYHEDLHINAYVDVLNEYKDKLQDAFYNAADSVMPVFVTKKSEIDTAINKFYEEIEKHPDFVLIMQKINNDVDSRNSKVDENEDGARLKQCIDKNWS